MARKKWNSEEKTYLEANHQYLPIAAMAQALGRTPHSVGSYLRAAGMARHYEKKRWTKGEVLKLYLYVERYGPHAISEKMKRPLTEIRRKIVHLKLKTRTEVYSQARARAVTGYHEYQLQRARDVLRQVWRRETFPSPRGGRDKVRFTITQKQLDALCEHLKTDPLKNMRKTKRALLCAA